MDAVLETRTRELAEALWRVEPSWRRPLPALGRRLLGGLDGRPRSARPCSASSTSPPPAGGRATGGPTCGRSCARSRASAFRSPLRPLRSAHAPRPPLAAYGPGERTGDRAPRPAVHRRSNVTDATRNLRRMWRSGQAFALDLLGESTVSEAEAEAYFERCEETLRRLGEVTRGWPGNPCWTPTPTGRCRAPTCRSSSPRSPRCSVLWRPSAGPPTPPAVCGRCCGWRATSGPHLHLDMEDYDSRETLLLAFEEVLADEEFRGGPSVGVVVQAYLRDADETLERILASPALGGRGVPPTIRLVKGAYWDHERVIAAQRGWEPPVWGEKRQSDACFERLSHALIDARDRVRPAIATHNLRSLAQAIAYLERGGGRPEELELQVLRGLGDELAEGSARLGYRVRVYTPIGDLVAGMAYLVRRLLENSSNQGFLLQQRHHSLDEMLDDRLGPGADERDG